MLNPFKHVKSHLLKLRFNKKDIALLLIGFFLATYFLKSMLKTNEETNILLQGSTSLHDSSNEYKLDQKFLNESNDLKTSVKQINIVMAAKEITTTTQMSTSTTIEPNITKVENSVIEMGNVTDVKALNETTTVKAIEIPQKWHLYVSSVYFVKDAEREYSKNVVRMNVLAKNQLPSLELKCEVDGVVTEAHKQKITETSSICSWGNHFIDCPTDKKPPKKVALLDNAGNKHEVQIIKTDKTPRTLVVCFSRLFLFENWRILLTALEMYNFYGADLMVLQIISIISQLHTILNAYEKAGKVRLKAAAKVPRFDDLDYDPNAELDWLGLATSYVECLYDYRDSAQFILNIDVDDIVIPRKFGTLKQELAYLTDKFPMASSFEFMWAPMLAKPVLDPHKFKISELMKNSHISMIVPYGKTAIRPKRIDFSHIHSPLETYIHGNFTHVKLTGSDPLTLHFRDWAPQNETLPPPNVYFADNNEQYKLLDLRLKHLIEKDPHTKQAFDNLPTTSYYYNIIHQCYFDLARQIENKTIINCPSPLLCKFKSVNTTNLSPCVSLKNEYVFTKMAPNFEIASLVKSIFLPVTNCLF